MARLSEARTGDFSNSKSKKYMVHDREVCERQWWGRWKIPECCDAENGKKTSKIYRIFAVILCF